jgi:hypothetical protein
MRLSQGCATAEVVPGDPAQLDRGHQTMQRKTNNAFSLSIAGFAIAFLISLTGAAQAASRTPRYWQDAPNGSLSAGTIAPDAYRSLELDFPAVQAELQIGGGVGQTISLPMPTGGFAEFMLSDSGTLPAELAARYPRIRSYLGTDSRGRHARIDVSPLGLNAMVFDHADSWMVRPISFGDGHDYVSFRRADVSSGESQFFCGTSEISAPDVFGNHTINTTTGATTRNYRAAVAANHNYVTAISGANTPTVELGLAAVVMAVNRVNEVYENDFSIHMTLIPNNDLIIYPDALTDPYSNGSGAISENTPNLNLVIGNSNYDIGHVFTTGSGGVAGLGVVCNNSQKGRGTTGLSNPASLQSDTFYIDYVAHEMGHQFGGNHTFNNSCSGNRAASAAYEPGSGSTIMAYAGVCSPNLQPHSDPYFHAKSLLEIGNFTNGSGGSCSTNGKNHGGPLLGALTGHTIPARTPFFLSGSASSNVPGTNLTFGWEQYDLGAINPDLAVDPGNGPIIRSFNPTVTPIRTIPNLADLLGGTTTIGEILPTTTRALNFRLTVFDNFPLAGTTESADLTLQVDSASGPFAVTAPAAGVTWDPLVSATEAVTWNVANTDVAPVSCANVDIDVYTGGGFGSSTAMLAQGVPNNGSVVVNVPNMQSATARVRVRCSDNIFFAMSPGNFTINGPDLIFANGFD